MRRPARCSLEYGRLRSGWADRAHSMGHYKDDPKLSWGGSQVCPQEVEWSLDSVELERSPSSSSTPILARVEDSVGPDWNVAGAGQAHKQRPVPPTHRPVSSRPHPDLSRLNTANTAQMAPARKGNAKAVPPMNPLQVFFLPTDSPAEASPRSQTPRESGRFGPGRRVAPSGTPPLCNTPGPRPIRRTRAPISMWERRSMIRRTREREQAREENFCHAGFLPPGQI